MRALVVIVSMSILVGACGGSSDRTVLVFAASSLTDAFAELESAYEAQRPEVDVELNLAGSSALREQILEGAPADVFAAADEAIMAEILAADLGAEHRGIFATNRLGLAVPLDNPGDVTELADVGDDGILVGVCAEAVPCGRFAAEVFERAGITPAPDTREPDVRSLLTKVAEDELDVGVVYVTDIAASADEVLGIEIPAAVNVEVRYPIATLGSSADGGDFVAFVLSERGRSILAEHGFGTP